MPHTNFSVYLSLSLPLPVFFLSLCLSHLSIYLCHPASQCIPIYPLLSMSLPISPCLTMYLHISPCLSPSLPFYLCLFLSIYVSPCLSFSLSLSPHVSPCLSMYLHVSPFTLYLFLPLYVSSCLSLSLYVYFCLFVSPSITPYFSISLSVSACFYLCWETRRDCCPESQHPYVPEDLLVLQVLQHNLLVSGLEPDEFLCLSGRQSTYT